MPPQWGAAPLPEPGPGAGPGPAGAPAAPAKRAATPAAEPAPAPWGRLEASGLALRPRNPIREIVEASTSTAGTAAAEKNQAAVRDVLKLSVGDPTAFGLGPPAAAREAVAAAARGDGAHGYGHSCGRPAAREAVARDLARHGPEVAAEDVFLAAGCSQALQLALACLAGAGAGEAGGPPRNVLLPRPGFPLYATICEHYGVEARHYDLRPERGWEADAAQLGRLADARTAAVVVCNPGNPTGQCWSRQHLEQVVQACRELRVPLVADEVYADMAFNGGEFVSAAAVCREVPCLVAGALSKRWLAPGWRLGWLAVYDRDGLLGPARVREGLARLCQITIGPCALIQEALPRILHETPAAFFQDTLATFEAGARYCCERLAAIDGLACPSAPQGAMYLMARVDLDRFPGLADDVAFAARLLAEEGVAVLPGTCFGAPGFFRIVVAVPMGALERAWDRIGRFAARHRGGPGAA